MTKCPCWSCALVIVVVALSMGCQGQVTQVAVHGMVTFDNAPVEDGQVAFEPTAAGKMRYGIISGGKYSIPYESGLVPGEYRVRITAARPTNQKAETDSFVTAEDSLVINEQFIPTKYNVASELVVKIEPVAEVTHDFSLTSQ